MTTVVTRGAASAQALGYASSSASVNYVEDVFSTYLYTGNGSTQTITNGIDLAGKGGLTWIKGRTQAFDHTLVDTVRGATNLLVSNTTAAQATQANSLTAFTSTGFSIGAGSIVNYSGDNFASWTFREQPKFFDIVTYTGNGVQPRAIAHNLGSTPGCMIVKNTSAGGAWYVYHRSSNAPGYTAAESYLNLNSTNAVTDNAFIWGNTAPTSTQFTVSTQLNQSANTYVAYLFAHDAGGFGLTGTDNVISCGSTNGSKVTLGYEPQWILYRSSNFTDDWQIVDNMRGLPVGAVAQLLKPNTSGAETTTSNNITIAADGFTLGAISGTAIYIAIRRGPMRVPTVGTSVFTPLARTGTGTNPTVVTTGTNPDLLLSFPRTASPAAYGTVFFDKLRGVSQILQSANTNAEATTSGTFVLQSFLNTGFQAGADFVQGYLNYSGSTYVNYAMTRAPGFFDEVCYTGTQVVRTVNHNLGAVPELIITKGRSGARDWYTYNQTTGNNKFLLLSSDVSQVTSAMWDNTSPTSTVFTLGGAFAPNVSGETYVAYLFATCPGVSKVGSYTGTGTTLQINCGFTAGSRFVLIKRTDSTGDWYVWDSARGIVAGNDPYLLLNSTAAEVTSTDYVDTYSAGFEISSTAPAAINANGGSFIFFAVS